MNFNFGGKDEFAIEEGEAMFLYGLVRALKPQVCLEIGTHKGYSTQHIIQGIKDNNQGHLWTTDPFFSEAINSLVFEDRKWCDFMSLRGEDVVLEQKIDFAFIDGLHEIKDVIPEIKNLLPQLNKNAIVLFHDAQNEKTNLEGGVNAAIKEMGLITTWIPGLNCFQIYQHNKII